MPAAKHPHDVSALPPITPSVLVECIAAVMFAHMKIMEISAIMKSVGNPDELSIDDRGMLGELIWEVLQTTVSASTVMASNILYSNDLSDDALLERMVQMQISARIADQLVKMLRGLSKINKGQHAGSDVDVDELLAKFMHK